LFGILVILGVQSNSIQSFFLSHVVVVWGHGEYKNGQDWISWKSECKIGSI